MKVSPIFSQNCDSRITASDLLKPNRYYLTRSQNTPRDEMTYKRQKQRAKNLVGWCVGMGLTATISYILIKSYIHRPKKLADNIKKILDN